ncbi:TPA: hypothetical protein G8W61_002205 [Salmonella enterica]|uniref:Uncharacterized protein n=1 Tax=Salmonella enterica TaxID=28901 RepID=A0A759YF44_SALER|nr:hypothetical protein [Salmonella enterica]
MNLLWLEIKEFFRDPAKIFRTLDDIVYTAQNTIEIAGHEAETVGCDDYNRPEH